MWLKNLLYFCDFFCVFDHANISHLTTDFFGCLFSDVVELGATGLRTFDYFDLLDHRRIEWENFFHPHTRGHSSHGEGGPGFLAMLSSKYQTLKSLEASFVLLNNFLPDTHCIPRPQVKFLPLFDIYPARKYSIHTFVY